MRNDPSFDYLIGEREQRIGRGRRGAADVRHRYCATCEVNACPQRIAAAGTLGRDVPSAIRTIDSRSFFDHAGGRNHVKSSYLHGEEIT